MSKGLEAWKELLKICDDFGCVDIYKQQPNKSIIEKELKALEIIKEKFVNVTILIGCDSLEEYNKHPLTMRKGRLTQEEYDLLKEVVLCQRRN